MVVTARVQTHLKSRYFIAYVVLLVVIFVIAFTAMNLLEFAPVRSVPWWVYDVPWLFLAVAAWIPGIQLIYYSHTFLEAELEQLDQRCHVIGSRFSGAWTIKKNSPQPAFTEKAPSLKTYIRLSWLPKVHQGFFLRAESFFNFASYLDELKREFPRQYDAYGGRSLHHQSHGESFLALFTHRFKNRDKALYLLDEPEAALSPARQLALLRLIWEHQQSGKSQFIIATHSPILLGYPNAHILNFDTAPLSPIHYEDTEHYVITKEFFFS